MRGLGWIKDEEDPRDHPVVIDDLKVTDAALITVRRQLGDVFDQGRLGSCVAQAVAKGIYAAHCRQGMIPPVPISRLAIYYLGRATLGKQRYNSGCRIRDVIKMINHFGFCSESVWPYHDETGPGARFSQMPATICFSMSFDQRASGGKPVDYQRIFEVGSERVKVVKRLLSQGVPVIFGTDVSQDLTENILPSSPIDPPIGKPIAGGHAMVISGYDGDSFEIMNSWGRHWGDQGFCRFSADYIAWSETHDLWSINVAPGFGR